uniref:Mediator of RNA polymerase II transcription subunit 16 n=1 Tax=Mesocestoides corti TaxID=53468 RepID=A0A5K3EFA3_MESCO
RNCCESCLFTSLNPVAPPPTQVPLVAACSQPRGSSTPPSLARIFILDYPHTWASMLAHV